MRLPYAGKDTRQVPTKPTADSAQDGRDCMKSRHLQRLQGSTYSITHAYYEADLALFAALALYSNVAVLAVGFQLRLIKCSSPIHWHRCRGVMEVLQFMQPILSGTLEPRHLVRFFDAEVSIAP